MDMNYNILVVDDVLENIQVVLSVLDEANYELSFATSGEMALELIGENDFDLILLDIMMPIMDGYAVCKEIKKLPNYQDVPIVFVTAKSDIDSISKAYKIGGVDYITKPFRKAELLARVATHLELYRIKEVLKQNNINLHVKEIREKERMETELEDNQRELIYLLTEMMEEISKETQHRSRRVAEMARLLASYHKSIDDSDVELIYRAAPTFDIGKTLIPQELLLKTTPLTEEEFNTIKEHTSKAHDFLSISNRKHIKAADIMAHQHHEKWNGTGYPRALKKEEIHIFGRILALVDVFDALMHKREYRGALSSEESIAYIIKNSGIHFDPYLVEIFQEHTEEFVTLANK